MTEPKVNPAELHARLSDVHHRGQLLNLLLGVMALGKWVIILFLVAFAVDWLFHIPAPGRALVLLGLLGVSVFKAWQRGWRLFKAFRPAHSALKVEEHYGDMESLLVTGVQLDPDEENDGTSAAMAELTVRKANEAASGLESKKVVPFVSLRKPTAVTGALFSVIVAIAIINAPLLIAGLVRIFTPWNSVSYPTRTHIELDDREIVVKEGDGVRIRALLSGEVPATAKLALRTGKGKPRKRSLKVVNNACEYRVASAFRSFDYAISAGDAETDWHTVKVISSPRVAETRIRLVYPEYMMREPDTMEAMTLTVPEGAAIEWDLTLDRAVKSASFTAQDAEAVPLKVSGDGLVVTHRVDAKSSGAYSFTWVEKEYEFVFDTPKHYLQVAPDQAPQVELTYPRANMFATVGRKMELKYRVRDDHGIGESRVGYRHNNAAEQFAVFASATTEGRAAQTIGWDYRKAVKSLEIGDTLTLAIEVSDRYPGTNGPHRVRSESRRITFLSKEDYLAKIHEQKDRLLSQLQAVYRQERAAYETIRVLDPADAAFEETCFLESARQDILAERILLLNEGIQELVDDLVANNITDRSEFEGLNELQSGLSTIASNHIVAAASRLRDLGPAKNPTVYDVLETAGTINNAARKLSNLVLRLGVRESLEVFAMEIHVIAQSQSALRVEAFEAKGKSPAMAARQKELAEWINLLLKELQENRDYSRAPLLIVRLSRMIKDLRTSGMADSMQKAAGLLAEGKLPEAASLQRTIIFDLFELESKIRVGSVYEALLNARELFASGINKLDEASRPDNAISAEDVEHMLSMLHREVRLLILPSIPAPETGLLAERPSDIPPVETMVGSAQDGLEKAMAAVRSNNPDQAKKQQQQVVGTLKELDKIIAVRLHEISKVMRYAGQSGAAMDRATLVREVFASQMRLTEKTEDAEYDEVSGAYLAPAQLHLSTEVLKMRDRLARKNEGDSASKLVVPMLEMLEQASEAMVKAAPALEKNELGDAIEHQDRALDALQGAMRFAGHESDSWIGLANLIITAEGMAMPAGFMRNIVSEQEDLIEATKNSTPETRKELVVVQTNLVLAAVEASSLVAGTGSALDFEQAVLFAGSDMGLSLLKLEANDVPGAMQAQRQAVDSVRDLSDEFTAAEKQYYYFVTVMEFLQEIHTDGVVLLDKLVKLQNALEDSKEPQDAVLAKAVQEAQVFSSLLMQATGRPDYTRAHASLESAMKALKAGNRDMSLDEVASAEEYLKESMEELRELMSHVAAVPAISPIEAPPEFDHMLDMVNIALAQKYLGATIYRARKQDLPGFVQKLTTVQEDVGALLLPTEQHEFIVRAHKLLGEAVAELQKSAGDQAYARLHESRTAMRQCALEYALYYVELPRSRRRKKKKKSKSTVVTMFKMTNKFRPMYDKNYGGVEGEDPNSGRAEWEVLGRRDRAALNENFVRELPLEYREFLKDYYERLTR